MFGGGHGVCAWCFDLMHLNGGDLRPLPLDERRGQLRNLLIEADDSTLCFSDDFPDPDKLLGAASRMGLERHRVEAARPALSLGTELRLDQGQDGDMARGEQGSLGDV
jgi:hypothetical protein